MDDSALEQALAELETVTVFGLRAGVQISRYWRVEGTYGYGNSTLVGETTIGTFEDDADVQLYFGSVYRAWPIGVSNTFLLGGGAGAIRFSRDGQLIDGMRVLDESETSLLLDLAAAVVIGVTERIGIRGDVRDHIQFCDSNDSFGCFSEDETPNHIEVSVGAEVLF